MKTRLIPTSRLVFLFALGLLPLALVAHVPALRWAVGIFDLGLVLLALADAAESLRRQGLVARPLLRDLVAATSVGLLEGEPLLDLSYAEDAIAEVDMNVVMTGGGAFVEVQGTAEERPFTQAQLDAMLELAARGIRQMVTVQREALGAAIAFARRPEGKG